MGCRCSKTVLTQVSDEAQIPANGDGNGAKCIGGGASSSYHRGVPVSEVDIAQPPGVVPSPVVHVLLPGQNPAADEPSLGSESRVSSAISAEQVVPGTVFSGPPGASAALEPLRLFPVQCTVEEIHRQFRIYVDRVPRDLARVLDVSWEHLSSEMSKAGCGPRADLEWYWMSRTEREASPSTADGLVVFRLVQGFSSAYCNVCHLSLTGDVWRSFLPGAIAAVRQEVFSSLPVSTMRAALWYTRQEDKQMVLDKLVEAAFKNAGFRWFQLNNTSDGKRGQIMALRRSEGADPDGPEQFVDLRFASCLFLPYSSEWQQCQRVVFDKSSGSSTRSSSEPSGNHLVLAECLRRHALTQPDTKCQELARAERRNETDPDAEQHGGEILVKTLCRTLTRRGTVKMVQSSDTTEFGECESFATACLAGIVRGRVPDSTSTVCRHLQDGSTPERRVLCGGLSLGVNWMHEPVADASNPGWMRVPVHATGHAPTEEKPTVVYLATDDDDVFIATWLLTRDNQLTHHELYQHCQQILQEAPPTCLGDARSVMQVALPCFHVHAPAVAGLPPAFAQVHGFAKPCEILGAKHTLRPSQRAVLKKTPPASPASMLRMDSAFVFCVWHSRLDDLEVPLFAMVIRPNDWETDVRLGR